MVQDEQEKWDIVIKPRSGLFRLDHGRGMAV